MWITIIIASIVGAIIYLQRRLSHWQSKGVKVPPGHPIIGHGYHLLVKPYPWKYVQQCYNMMKGEPYWGLYEMGAPRLFLRDLDVIKDITIKDFDHFVDRRHFPFNKEHCEVDRMFSESLFHEKGDKWKKLRASLSPTFTSGKIKAMYPTIEAKADELIAHLGKLSEDKGSIEMRKPLGKYTLSVIATSSFGMELPIDETHTDFDKHVDILGVFDFFLLFKIFLLYNFPTLGKPAGIQLVPKEMDYFYNVIDQACAYRKKNNVRRDDFLDLMNDLCEEEKSGESKYRMTMRSLVAQSILFIVAGYDTTGNTLGFACYLIAKHPQVQERLRDEIKEIYENEGELSYHNIMEAKYLDAVLSEVLRIYPQAHVIERFCTETYKMEKTGLVIPKGSVISIPAYSLHHDEDYWESPDEFIPERFLPENKHKINPYAYCPFGYGQRNCIGMRFAQMEAKLALAKIVTTFSLSLPKDKELILNSGVFVIKASDHGVHIKLDAL